MKAINVIFLIGAIVLTWLTEAKTEDKIFLTIFFSLAIGFWLMAMSGEDNRAIYSPSENPLNKSTNN